MKKLLLLTRLLKTFVFTFSMVHFAESQVTINVKPDKDNSIYSAHPEGSNGLGEFLVTGRQGASASFSILRSLLHFDVRRIPAGSTINSATLVLDVLRARDNSTVSLHKLTANWGEGTSGGAVGSSQEGFPATEGDATWEHAFYPNTKWSTPGGDYLTSPSAISGTISMGTLVIPNLAADVQLWVSDTSNNFGWMLKATDDSLAFSAKLVRSRQFAVDSLRPTLHISYSCNGGSPTDICGNGIDDNCNGLVDENCAKPPTVSITHPVNNVVSP